MVVSNMPDRQDHATNDGRRFLAEFAEQSMAKIGNRDQSSQPAPSKNENSAVFVAATTQKQGDEADRQHNFHQETVKPFIGHES